MSNYSPSRSTIVTSNSGNSVSIPASDLSRIVPRQISTGTMRGTQNVGYGSAKIDGSNNRITVGAPDGSSIGMGAIPGSLTGEYGFFSLDKTGKLILKIVTATMYVYNPKDSYHNVTQNGLLPDGSGGSAVAAPGSDVIDMFP